MDNFQPDIFNPIQAAIMQKLTMQAINGPVEGILHIDGKSLLETLSALEYSHEDLACLVQHINEKRPHLKRALRFVALWNIKNGRYVKDNHPIFDKTTIQKIDDFVRQEKDDYDFFDTCAQVTEALRQDEENLAHDKAGGAAHSSIWEEKKWEWHVFQR